MYNDIHKTAVRQEAAITSYIGAGIEQLDQVMKDNSIGSLDWWSKRDSKIDADGAG